jgi:hypothetical protein
MKHYSLDRWVDFARGVIGDRERAAMQSHLDEGCPICQEAVALWKRVRCFEDLIPVWEP